jgi:class I fructose-bisphosphate aldolase
MKITETVGKILSHYESDTPGTKTNLARILMHGRLGGTGSLLVLAIDQGFEHGPARSFAINPAAYDPHYHYQLAVEASLSAYAAPLGMLEAGADTFAGAIPTILKINSSNSLSSFKENPDQAVTASIHDALRLGCSAIGFTLYPGSDMIYDLMEELRELAAEAKAVGLAVVVWSYIRGRISKPGETAIDTIAYGAHMAALLGAHIIKVKMPSDFLENEAAKQNYITHKIDISTPEARVRHVMDAAFTNRRIVLFSGGEAKNLSDLYGEAKAIHQGGGHGSIIGRNAFQRPLAETLSMFNELEKIYKS